MALSFADCRADHLPAVRAFFARAYRPDYILSTDEAFFRWQFAGAAAGDGGAYHLKLALLDDEVAGCLGYIPVGVSLCGRIARGAWVINWMVDPERRRFGLGPSLMREVTNRFDVTLNIGPNGEARDLLGRMGWTDLGELTRYVCVLDERAAASLTEAGKLRWPPAGASPGAAETPTGALTMPVSRFSDDATHLWDRVWGQLGAGTRRSAAFLNRRYADHPLFDYRLFETRRGERLHGLAVYRVEQVRGLPVRVGRIVEVVSDADAEVELVGAVIRDARSQGAGVLDFFCASRRCAVGMGRMGFFEVEGAAQLPILFQPIDRRRTGITFMAYLRNVADAAGLRDWYVTKGDGDQDRPN